MTSNLVRFLIRSSCSRWSWSFSCSSWERTFFSVAAVWVTEETWKWEHQTCDHMTWYYVIWPRKTGRNNNTDLVKAPFKINNFISIPFEQCSIIRHLCHVRIVLHLLCSAGKLQLENGFKKNKATQKSPVKTHLITFGLTCRVLSVSSKVAGVMVQMMTVLAFPPKEFCKIRVSLLSL